MAATKINFSPSINIVRDSDYEFNYITTPNASNTFTAILNDIVTGTKAHVIIGAFGTGKSSFLLAFKQTLEKSFNHFKGYGTVLNSIPDYEFISIVGEYASLEELFANRYQLGKKYTSGDVIKSIDKEYKALKKKGIGFAFLVDEFGKFLDYAAKNNPKSELYFIQQLAVWVNDSNNDTLFITTLHQDLSAYSLKLDKLQRQEWDKVKGRLKEVAFNERVEQLLFLAVEYLKQNKADRKAVVKPALSIANKLRVFNINAEYAMGVRTKFFPFDLIGENILFFERNLGIPLPLLRTRQTHRQGRAIRFNLFSQRTMQTQKKGFPLLSLMQNIVSDKIYKSTLYAAA